MMPYFQKNSIFFRLIILIIAGTSILSSCENENFTTSEKSVLTFSKDTLTFDTVFTSIGSTTEKILIYNPNKRPIRISSIDLASGKNSSFRINVDGRVNLDNHFENVEINAKDSAYIFVEVTVDPTNSNSPVLIADSIVFTTNGQRQRVRLEAFGQDMVLLNNHTFKEDTKLTADKPYLIYGSLIVDSAKTITLSPGCKMYFHNNANFIINGNLIANGTFEMPIDLRGDRLDEVKFVDPVPYHYIAGQWGGVFLLWSKGVHQLKHVNITSAYVGLYFVNNDRAELPQLKVENCRLHNFVYYGLVAQNANVEVVNSEISNTGSSSVYLSGGKHVFIQSTIANYYSSNGFEPTSRDKNPSVMIMNLYRNAPMESIFKNCVVSGGMENELTIATRNLKQYNATFSNCYIRRKDTLNLSQFDKIKWYTRNDTLIFKRAKYDNEKQTYFDFTPDSISPIRGIANLEIAKQYPIDLNGNSRISDNAPDAGAYEWVPKK